MKWKDYLVKKDLYYYNAHATTERAGVSKKSKSEKEKDEENEYNKIKIHVNDT